MDFEAVNRAYAQADAAPGTWVTVLANVAGVNIATVAMGLATYILSYPPPSGYIWQFTSTRDLQIQKVVS